MPDRKTQRRRKSGGTPPRYDGKKYNYEGTPFGYKTQNKLKSEYKNKQNEVLINMNAYKNGNENNVKNIQLDLNLNLNLRDFRYHQAQEI